MIIALDTDNPLGYSFHPPFIVSASLTNHPLILTSFNRAFISIMFVVRVLAHLTVAFEAGACRHNKACAI